MATIFECENASKAYGGLQAVKDLSFSVEEGEIYAIAGPNGAGKTTLFDTITGVSLAHQRCHPFRWPGNPALAPRQPSAGWASRARSRPPWASTPRPC